MLGDVHYGQNQRGYKMVVNLCFELTAEKISVTVLFVAMLSVSGQIQCNVLCKASYL